MWVFHVTVADVILLALFTGCAFVYTAVWAWYKFEAWRNVRAGRGTHL